MYLTYSTCCCLHYRIQIRVAASLLAEHSTCCCLHYRILIYLLPRLCSQSTVRAAVSTTEYRYMCRVSARRAEHVLLSPLQNTDTCCSVSARRAQHVLLSPLQNTDTCCRISAPVHHGEYVPKLHCVGSLRSRNI